MQIFAQYEWLIIEAIVMAVLIRELISIRRLLRKSRAEDAARRQDPPA